MEKEIITKEHLLKEIEHIRNNTLTLEIQTVQIKDDLVCRGATIAVHEINKRLEKLEELIEKIEVVDN